MRSIYLRTDQSDWSSETKPKVTLAKIPTPENFPQKDFHSQTCIQSHFKPPSLSNRTNIPILNIDQCNLNKLPTTGFKMGETFTQNTSNWGANKNIGVFLDTKTKPLNVRETESKKARQFFSS